MKARTVEWLNENRYRVYPFVENSSLAVNGASALSLATILDFSLVTTLTSLGAAQTLQSFTVTADGVTFNFGGTFTFNLLVPSAASFPYLANGTQDGVYYTTVFGEGCTALMSLPAATYTMAEPPVIQPALLVDQSQHRVDSITAQGIGQARLTGTIWIEPGYNCDPVVGANFIRFSVAPGRGAGRYCTPLSDDVLSCRDAFLWWNGQNASQDGNYLLAAGTGLVVENVPASNLIIIRAIDTLDSMNCG